MYKLKSSTVKTAFLNSPERSQPQAFYNKMIKYSNVSDYIKPAVEKHDWP